MFQTDNITQPCNRSAGAEEIAELSLAIQRGGIENDVRMDVFFIHVGADDESMISFQKTLGKFITDPVCFLRCDFSRLERLANLILDHITLLLPSGDRVVLPFGIQKLRIGGVWITLVCGDQFGLIGFVGIFSIVGSFGKALCDLLTFVLMHGNDAGCGDGYSSCSTDCF